MEPDMAKVDALAVIEAELPSDRVEIREMTERAGAYIRSFSWCDAIVETYAGILIPRVIGVFLHHIIPAREDVDMWVWSVIGDVPPAYISLDDAANPAAALDGYIGAMRAWTEAVRLGMPVDELIPVNVPPQLEFADMLDRRLDYLADMLEVDYADDLEA
jgi:hypothetical protein